MLTWLFERKIFSPTISDLSTFLHVLKKNVPFEKLVMQNFIFDSTI